MMHDPKSGTGISFWRAGWIHVLPNALLDSCLFMFHKGNVSSFMKFNKSGGSRPQPEQQPLILGGRLLPVNSLSWNMNVSEWGPAGGSLGPALRDRHPQNRDKS